MTNEQVKFTVVIPTSLDRGLLLPYSVESILKQTVQDFEIFIIGDGVNDYTREVIQELQKQDNRIHFFDFPKHPRRGEENRHQVLSHAKGSYVTYLCDRDLMLQHHLSTLEKYLQKSNFVSTLHFDVKGDSLKYGFKNVGNKKASATSLSCTAHTLELYRALPFGWRTTPNGKPTDLHMWNQFLDHPKCKPYSGMEPTILWFKRGHHPGLSSAERKLELVKWCSILEDQDIFYLKKEEALAELMEDYNFLHKNHLLLIKGRKPSQVPGEILKKIKSLLKLQ